MPPFALLLILCQTMPSDSTMDWLLTEKSAPAATQPATEPATQPTSPLTQKPQAGEVPATITLSDGATLIGRCWTTVGKPLRVWDDEKKQYVDLSLEMIASMDAEVLWERDEAEWRFKTSGEDEKVYTGKTYPARETQYKVTLANGANVTGGIVAPIYVKQPDQPTRQLVLHKRAKGDVGQTLKQLVYVKSIRVGEASK